MTTIAASNPLLDYEPSYAWNSTHPQTNQNGSSVSVQFEGTTLKAFGRTKLQVIFYTEDDSQVFSQPISNHGGEANFTILNLPDLKCSNHTVKLILDNSNPGHHSLTLDRFEYTPCTPNATLTQPSIPFTPIIPPPTTAAQSTSPSTSSASLSSTSSSSTDTAKTVGIALGCVLGALLVLSAAGLLWCRRRHRMRHKKPPSASFLVLSSPDLPPYIPLSARSKYAPAADGRAPPPDEKSEVPAPATRPVEGTSGAAYLRGYLPDSKEWLRNAERARVAAATAAAAAAEAGAGGAAQSAHGEPGGHAAAYGEWPAV